MQGFVLPHFYKGAEWLSNHDSFSIIAEDERLHVCWSNGEGNSCFVLLTDKETQKILPQPPRGFLASNENILHWFEFSLGFLNTLSCFLLLYLGPAEMESHS